jgi:two-component system, OmpR family, sensor histidine kinase MprB
MTLRARLAALASVAVALAVLAASVAAWLLIRSTVMDEFDSQLADRVGNMRMVSVQLDGVDDDEVDWEKAAELAARMIEGDGFAIRRLEPGGQSVGVFPPGAAPLDVHPDEQALVTGERTEPVVRTAELDGITYRVMTVPVDDGRVLQVQESLASVERTMTRMAWLLAGVAVLGVGLAGGFGWLVARAGLRPVDRLAAAAEQVATTKDLAHRVDVDGNQRDEVARLAGSMNAMLAALDGARTQQRHLVEDAGHELRTPLATLRNDIGLLVRAEQHPERAFSPADRASLLHDLEAEAAGLSDLVNELVDLARGTVEPEPFLETDMRALVDRAVARTRRVNPQVMVEVHGTSFEAWVRPAMLERAVANLVRNALQVSRDGRVVEVELATDNSDTIVEVRDRGPGIAERDLPRLFDRFYRGEGARQRPGSGLGLAIVAQAAEHHGGRATAANRGGGGAVFVLRVPTRPALS